LPAVHEHVMHRIHTPLSDLESAAVIIDGWELKHHKMIGVVIQYINPQWKLHTDMIGLLQVNQSHTASTIFSFVDARLQEVLDKETMIAACVSDNGSNYTNASKLISNNEGWPCVCHTLQLVVQDVLGDYSSHHSKLWHQVQVCAHVDRMA